MSPEGACGEGGGLWDGRPRLQEAEAQQRASCVLGVLSSGVSNLRLGSSWAAVTKEAKETQRESHRVSEKGNNQLELAQL